MLNRRTRVWAVLLLMGCCASCLAADAPGDSDVDEMIPPSSQWPGVVVIASAGLFVMAAVIGPVVRAHRPGELPATHSFDEPPGSSHHQRIGESATP